MQDQQEKVTPCVFSYHLVYLKRTSHAYLEFTTTQFPLVLTRYLNS